MGALVPTGDKASEALAKAAGVEDARLVLEVGAGTGPVTKAILELAPQARLISVERDPELAAIIRNQHQPRIHFGSRCDVVTGDARDARRFLAERGHHQVDSVVAAIPFTMLSADEQAEILDMVDDVLASQGGFSSIVYVHSVCLPAFWRFVRALKKRFPKVTLLGPVWKNVPPAFILKATKD